MLKKFKLIILGVNKGERRLDRSKSIPSGLGTMDSQTSLERIILLFKRFNFENQMYVGGYHLEKVIEKFPDLKIKYFRHWQEKGEIGALCDMNFQKFNYLFIRADTIFSESLFKYIHSFSRETVGYLENDIYA